LANIVDDRALLEIARNEVEQLLSADPELSLPEHQPLSVHLKQKRGGHAWAKIS
jgi:ATP-dependent DNA helicase RecG